MKTTLTLLALGLFLIGCGKKESTLPKKTPQVINQSQKQPEKPKGKPTAQPLTGEEAFEILKTGLSGITVDKSNKTFQIVVDNVDPDYPSVTFVSRVPPDFPTDKSVANQNMRRITFCIEDKSDKRRLVMYQSPLHKLQAEAKEELEPKRWVLGPEIDISPFFLFWSDEFGEWIDEWTESNSLPSRLKVELAFKKPDGSEPMLSDILSCEVFSPDAAKSHLAKAEKGDAQAQYNSGMMYSNGNHVKKDFKEAAKWWRKSAEQGKASSQAFLALSYFRGEGVPKDFITGYAWTHIAEINGVADDFFGDDILIYEKVKSLARKMTDAQKNMVIRMTTGMINKNPKLLK
jgi:hypothetical protein